VIETHQHAGDFQGAVDYPFQVYSRLNGFSPDYWNAMRSTFLTFVGFIDGFTKRFASLWFSLGRFKSDPLAFPMAARHFPWSVSLCSAWRCCGANYVAKTGLITS
jgi:hypothetical protein